MPGSLDLLAVFDALPGAYLLLTPALVIEAVSDAYLASSFTTRQQLVGQYLFDVFGGEPGSPEARTMTNLGASLQQVLATGQPDQMPVQHYAIVEPTTGARVVRYWQPVNTPVQDAHGTIIALVHCVTDVTAQTQAAAALHLSQAREQQARAEVDAQRRHLQQMLRHLPAQIATYRGPDYVYDFVNTRYTRPLPNRQYLGRPIREVLPEVATQGLLAIFDQVYHTGEPVHRAEQELWLDLQGMGQPQQLYLDFFLYPLRDAEGHIYGLLDFSYDITAQVQARQQVQQLNDELEERVLARTRQVEAARQAAEAQQHYLRHLFEQAPVAICLMRGPQAVVELLNQHGAALVGRSPAQVVGRPIREALPVLNNQGFEALYQRVLQGETLVFDEMFITFDRAHTGQADQGYFHHTYQPWREEAGAIVGVINIGVEVTEQVRARQQVQDLNEKLAAINEELTATNEELHTSNRRLTRTNVDLDTFVYTASHDLKAPITNIESILHALRDTLPAAVQQDPVVSHLLGLLAHTVDRFRLTIDQLTDLTRLQQTYNEPPELLLLGPIVQAVLADLAPAVTAAAARITLEVPTDLQVAFAPASLRSVVYNLLSNAVKYRAPERPAQVWLRAEHQPGQVVLTVRDNGLGLSEAQQKRLFGVFQRLHTHVEGTGVGLYMIKRLLENAGATITVTSASGVGSTFTVVFPTIS